MNEMKPITPETTDYRSCVGIMLVNREGKVFVAERLDSKARDHTAGYWQMPQGGVDPGEDLRVAALRELAEETGVSADAVTIIGQTQEPLRYDLPDDLIGKMWGGKYRGQEQIWFLARFHGEDSDIDLDAHDPPEFGTWKWIDPEDLPGIIVPFKKLLYRTVLEEFRALI